MSASGLQIPVDDESGERAGGVYAGQLPRVIFDRPGPKTQDGKIIKNEKGEVVNRGSKACNACHGGPVGKANDVGMPQESNPVDPYTGESPQNNSNLKPYVIFDHPDKTKIVPDNDKKDGSGGRLKANGVEVRNVSGLKDSCDCIKKEGVGAKIEAEAKQVDKDAPRQANTDFVVRPGTP